MLDRRRSFQTHTEPEQHSFSDITAPISLRHSGPLHSTPHHPDQATHSPFDRQTCTESAPPATCKLNHTRHRHEASEVLQEEVRSARSTIYNEVGGGYTCEKQCCGGLSVCLSVCSFVSPPAPRSGPDWRRRSIAVLRPDAGGCHTPAAPVPLRRYNRPAERAPW